MSSDLAAKAKGAVKMVGSALQGHTGVLSTLAKEHGMVSSLLNQAVDSTDKVELAGLSKKIRVELLSHARAEERTIYAFLAQHPEAVDLVMHAKHEHDEVAKAFEQMDQLILGSQDWRVSLAVLRESVERHVEEEESDLFDRAQALFSDGDSRRLDEAFQQEKHTLRNELGRYASAPGR